MDCSKRPEDAKRVAEVPPAPGSGRRPGALATALATLSGNLYLVLASLVLGSAAILTSWIGRPGDLVFRIARLWSRGLLLTSGVKVAAGFEQAVAPGRTYIFMSNHLSMYDIPLLLATLPVQTRFLAKSSLFKIPVFGWALRRGGFVDVDREDRSRARESFRSLVDRVRGGASILIFPEGSRSLDGTLQGFERGGFLLALKTGLPIVPVGIRGTFEVQRRGELAIRPGRTAIRYGAPIEVEGYGLKRRAELAERVRERIAGLLVEPAAPPGRGCYDGRP